MLGLVVYFFLMVACLKKKNRTKATPLQHASQTGEMLRGGTTPRWERVERLLSPVGDSECDAQHTAQQLDPLA